MQGVTQKKQSYIFHMKHFVYRILIAKNAKMNILIIVFEDFNIKWKSNIKMNMFISSFSRRSYSFLIKLNLQKI